MSEEECGSRAGGQLLLTDFLINQHTTPSLNVALRSLYVAFRSLYVALRSLCGSENWKRKLKLTDEE